MEKHTRRDLIRITAGAFAAVPLVAQSDAPAKHKFFTDAEFRLVDQLSEIIIPADEHSPGARAAKVADYIDQVLAESFDEEPRLVWRDGLALINTLSRKRGAKDFLQATPAEQVELLTAISKNEFNPKDPEEIFFREFKTRAASTYYTSKIGIHQEIEYKGNSILQEFAGFDADLAPVKPPEHPV